MATVAGKQALVTYKGVFVDHANDYSADVAVDIRDHTSFTTGTVFFRVTKPGLAGGTATVNMFYDPTSTAQDDIIEAALAGSTGNMIFELDKDTGGGLSYAGTYFNSLTANASIDGDSTIAVGVTSNGAVTYTTST